MEMESDFNSSDYNSSDFEEEEKVDETRGQVFNKQRKVYEDVDGQKVNCDHCKLSFDTNSELAFHLKHHRMIHCLICERRFSNRLLYDLHLRVHAGDYTPYPCKMRGCSEKFISISSWLLHLQTHGNPRKSTASLSQDNVNPGPFLPSSSSSKVEPEWIQCQICRKKCANEHGLAVHTRRKHPPKKRLPCGVPGCEEEFSTEGIHMWNHWKKEHPSSLIRCQILNCDRVFIDQKSLIYHQESSYSPHQHDDVPCPKCHKVMKRDSLRRHIKLHMDKTRVSCPKCQKSFQTKELMETHVKSTHVTDLPFKCRHCTGSKGFKTEKMLQSHIKICLGPILLEDLTLYPEIQRFRCDYEGCGKVYFSKKILENHKPRHNNSGYECSICHYQAQNQLTMLVHVKSKHKSIIKGKSALQWIFEKGVQVKSEVMEKEESEEEEEPECENGLVDVKVEPDDDFC